ncbi:MAG: adenylate/guanylate cyclase domain-containing protein [Leptospiraceae bacterium]|nr:adenylate/guanylate cyclase domain-containing protein [Leptospiraceae bacterium]MCP5499731.1 adenylate/guanylate cyclase domain-containing protein [Leptospiraceae bacterium]
MKYRFIYLLLILCLPVNFLTAASKATKGLFVLSEPDLQNSKTIQLYGEWEFYYGEFISPETFLKNPPEPKHYIQVPALWNEYIYEGKELPGSGYATYHLKVKLVSDGEVFGIRIGDMYSAYSLWINGKLIAKNGEIGKTKENMKAQWLPQTRLFHHQGEELDIVIHISNFHHRKAGTWSDLLLGKAEDILQVRERAILFELFLFGSLLIMTFYHVGLFVLRKKEPSTLYFALFCFAAILRLLITGERYIIQLFPNAPFEVQLKLEYISFYISLPFFVYFVYLAFAGYISKKALNLSKILAGLLILFCLISTGVYYSHTAVPYQIVIFLYAFYIMFVMFSLIVKKVEGSLTAFLGFLAFGATVVIDTLYNNELISFGNIVPLGVFIFIFSQSFLLSQKFSNAFRKVESLSEDLNRTNKAYSYFVPTEFLKILNISHITNIRLGDQVEGEMTILFLDIRSFTQISENLSPKETFDYINRYLKIVAPIIRNMGGFVDKYIGDAVMAIFPTEPDNALKAGIKILKRLNRFNQKGIKYPRYIPIQIGMGIHTGRLMLGTIGEKERMEGTVISDAVNLASRIEGLTRYYYSSLIITKETLDKVEKTQNFQYRYLGKVRVKGKKERVHIFDVFNGDSEEVIHIKLQTRGSFEKAVLLYFDKNFAESEKLFEEVLKQNPEDILAVKYLKHCKKYKNHSPELKNELSEEFHFHP